VAVNGVNVKNMSQKDIKSVIVQRLPTVDMSVVTPMPPSMPLTKPTKQHDTITSSVSSGSADMQQMDTMTGTWKNKMRNLTFLKTKKSAPKDSLRNK